MPDRRRSPYIKLLVGAPHHPSIVGLSDAAFRAWITMLCDAGAALTDGVIPAAAWGRMWTAKVRAELTSAGRVDVAPDGSVALHGYLEVQPSRADREAVSSVRAAAGSAGGTKRAANRKQSATVLPSKDQAILEVEVETDGPTPNGVAPSPRKRVTKRTAAPETLELDQGMREWARINVPTVDLERETAQFLDHHAAKGNTFVDWRRAWMTWMRNAAAYPHTSRPANGSTTDARVAAAQQLKRPEVEA